MKRQSLIAVSIALILGVVAVYLANTFLLVSQENEDARGTTKIAVAAVPLKYGVQITTDRVRFVDFPNGSIPAGSFRNLDQLLPKGQLRVALTSIAANEPILSSKVTGAGQRASIALTLPDGMRAASVRINDVSGVAGFIQPNDAVDVLITREIPTQGNVTTRPQVTDLLLQNIRVIAIGQNSQAEDGKPEIAKSATLQVDPVGAQKLALAQEVGSLSLVLRKPGQQQDSAFAETVSLGDLRSGVIGSARYQPRPSTIVAHAPRPQPQRAVRRPAAPKTAPRPATNNVQVVRGTEGNSYEVGGYGS